MTAIKRFTAHTVKVSAPNLVDVSLRLDFGVLLERQVRIANAPPADSLGAMYNAALQCLIVLCGGKSLVVDLDPSQRNHEVNGVVAVASRTVPLDCGFSKADGTRLLDVGAYLYVLREHGYDRRMLLAALNGKSRHRGVGECP